MCIDEDQIRKKFQTLISKSELFATSIHYYLCEKDLRGIKGKSNYLMVAVLVIALSTHAVFQGIALGLANSLGSNLNIMIALFCHKAYSSLSLGVSLYNKFQNKDYRATVILMANCMATPLGILVGLNF